MTKINIIVVLGGLRVGLGVLSALNLMLAAKSTTWIMELPGLPEKSLTQGFSCI